MSQPIEEVGTNKLRGIFTTEFISEPKDRETPGAPQHPISQSPLAGSQEHTMLSLSLHR